MRSVALFASSFALACLVSCAGEPTADAPHQVGHPAGAGAAASPIGDVESLVVEAVTRRWEQQNPAAASGLDRGRFPGVEIVALQRADCLLDASRVGNYGTMPKCETPVYLVYAVAAPGWWKRTTHHVLVFVKREDHFREVLHFSGGGGGGPIAYRLENIGSDDKDKFAILVEDYACGNHQTRTRLHLFCYDEKRAGFTEVFNEVIEYSRSPIGGDCLVACFDSDYAFRSSAGDVKDLVVFTRLEVYPARSNTALHSERETVFRWDGERYVGELGIPGFETTRPGDTGERAGGKDGEGATDRASDSAGCPQAW